MFGVVRKLTESDELVSASGVFVRSGVWLKIPERLVENGGVSRLRFILRDVGQPMFEVIRVGRDGEMYVFDAISSEGANGSAGGMVQSMLGIPQSMTGELNNVVGDGVCPELDECLASLRINLLDDFISVAAEKSPGGAFKFLDVFASPIQKAPGA